MQVYRHLLFNRLGRDDDKFDVHTSFPTLYLRTLLIHLALNPPSR